MRKILIVLFTTMASLVANSAFAQKLSGNIEMNLQDSDPKHNPNPALMMPSEVAELVKGIPFKRVAVYNTEAFSPDVAADVIPEIWAIGYDSLSYNRQAIDIVEGNSVASSEDFWSKDHFWYAQVMMTDAQEFGAHWVGDKFVDLVRELHPGTKTYETVGFLSASGVYYPVFDRVCGNLFTIETMLKYKVVPKNLAAKKPGGIKGGDGKGDGDDDDNDGVSIEQLTKLVKENPTATFNIALGGNAKVTNSGNSGTAPAVATTPTVTTPTTPVPGPTYYLPGPPTTFLQQSPAAPTVSAPGVQYVQATQPQVVQTTQPVQNTACCGNPYARGTYQAATAAAVGSFVGPLLGAGANYLLNRYLPYGNGGGGGNQVAYQSQGQQYQGIP